MDFKDLISRVRRFVFTSVCFFASVLIVYRGNTFESHDFAMIVPVMCALTGLVLTVLGLAIFVKPESSVG